MLLNWNNSNPSGSYSGRFAVQCAHDFTNCGNSQAVLRGMPRIPSIFTRKKIWFAHRGSRNLAVWHLMEEGTCEKGDGHNNHREGYWKSIFLTFHFKPETVPLWWAKKWTSLADAPNAVWGDTQITLTQDNSPAMHIPPKKKHPMFGIERVSYSILTKSVWFNHIILYSALVSVMIPLVFGSSNVWLNKRNKFFRMIRMTSQSWFRPLPAGKVNGKINYYDALVCCAANDGDPATKCNVHSAVGWTLEICFGYAWNPDLATSNFGLLYPSPEWIFAVIQPNVDIDMLRGFREEKRDTSKSYRRTNTMFQSIKNIGNRTVATLAILWLNVSCWNFRI